MKNVILSATSGAALGVAGVNILVGLRMLKESVAVNKSMQDLQPLMQWPFVSVLVPARNEDKTIIACLTSILAQDYPNFEVIVIDDNSTDGTHALVSGLVEQYSDHLRLVRSTPPVAGWLGKTNALWQGVKYINVSANWLLFVDADTQLLPNALWHSVSYALNHDFALFSLVPKIQSFWHQLLMPELGKLYAMAAYTPFHRIKPNSVQAATANGAFILVNRAAYEAVGGHSSVRGSFIEDAELAQCLHAACFKTKINIGSTYTVQKPKGGLRSVWASNRRIWFFAVRQNWASLLFVLAVEWLTLLPVALLVYHLIWRRQMDVLWKLNICAVCAIVAQNVLLLRVLHSPVFYAFLHPVSVILSSAIVVDSAVNIGIRRTVSWKKSCDAHNRLMEMKVIDHNTASSTYDVVVVGAGPGGAAAAYYLSAAGFSVLLLDKSDFPRDKTCGDGITPRALSVLKDMGLLDELNQQGCPVSHMQIIAPNGRSVAISFGKQQDKNASYVIPRLKLDDLILRRALMKGASFKGNVRVNNVVPYSSHVVVQGDSDGQPIDFIGRIAVIATGASMTLLRTMGVIKHIPPMILAARAYFEDIRGLRSDCIQLRFKDVPLPGYGWIFPHSATAANIGVMIHPNHTRNGADLTTTSRSAFENFIASPALKKILDGAHQSSAYKGYPIHTTFVEMPPSIQRVLLVGEVAGLVNPLTGDGTDYALISGRLAAKHIIGTFHANDFSPQKFQEYNRLVKRHYLPLLKASARASAWLRNPFVFNQMMRGAAFNASFTQHITNMFLE